MNDRRWMGAALALAERGRGLSWPNPAVGCVIVRDGRVVGRGWTQAGGRPHAEAVAMAEAADAAAGATVYTTLEPCAHVSARGPACADLLVATRPARVAVAMIDPDPRTAGQGIARLRAAGIDVTIGEREAEARAMIGGFLTRQALGRPFVTLKLATSLDGCIALASGESRWITGPEARAHAHLERTRHEAILVGRGTFDADAPRLDVRLAGLAERSPQRVLLSTGTAPAGWTAIPAPEAIAGLPCDHLLVEGGAHAAAAFLRAGLVDRLLLYRAPILLGGLAGLAELALAALGDAHGQWRLADTRMLGSDRLEVYLRASPGKTGSAFPPA